MTSARTNKLGIAYYVMLCALLWLITVVLNWPGHYSLDSMLQLIEGMTDTFVTFNPPLMAQILAFTSRLGGHGLFMALNAFIFSLAVFLIFFHSIKKTNKIYASLLLVFVFLNPISLIYNGIVWKDVFSANLSLLAIAFSLFVTPKRLMPGLVSVVLIAISINIRPQAIVVLPVSAIIICISYMQASSGVIRKFLLFLLLIIFGLTASKLISTAVKFGQHGTSVEANKVGFLVAAKFDIAGMIFYSKNPENTLKPFFENPKDIISLVRRDYTPERVDTLSEFSLAASKSHEINVFDLWIALAKEEPSSLLIHKFNAAAKLFGFRLHGECLPAHLGVADNSVQVANKLGIYYVFPDGFLPKLSEYHSLLFKYLNIGLIFFTGWLWLIINIVLLLSTPFLKSKTIFCLTLCGVLYSGIFILVGVACDFRYQYFSVLCAILGCLELMASKLFCRNNDSTLLN